jgi:hypothetical protein
MPVSALTIWNISESEPKKKQATQPEGLLCWACGPRDFHEKNGGVTAKTAE